MRKVKFKVWIPIAWTTSGEKVPGTNCWSETHTESGVFHEWSQTYTEFETGTGNQTMAVVEKENGEVVEVLPFNLKFVKSKGASPC